MIEINIPKIGEPMSEGQCNILSRFSFHKPDASGVEKMSTIRRHVRQLAFAIEQLCPESREKATALTNLATVMMNANSSIVQTYPLDPTDV